jgi:hypothetical protein
MNDVDLLMVWAKEEAMSGNMEKACKLGNIANRILDRQYDHINTEKIAAAIKLFFICAAGLGWIIILTKI